MVLSQIKQILDIIKLKITLLCILGISFVIRDPNSAQYFDPTNGTKATAGFISIIIVVEDVPYITFTIKIPP